MAGWGRKSIKDDTKSPEWQAENLTWIEPVKGQRWQVYKAAAPQFEGLLKDLIAAGYKPTSSGGYNYRNIRGGNKLSEHAFGTAIDMNAMTNAMGQKATDIPNARELAEKWNLEWGGNWKGRPDPMHFEYRGDGQPVTRDDVAKAAVSTANPITDYSIGPNAEAAPIPAPAAATPPTFDNPISGYGGGPQGAKPPATPATPAKAKGKKTWGELLADIGADFGTQGGAGVATIPTSTPTQTRTAPGQSIAPVMEQPDRRQQLAEALARLNTGRLFAG